jgi:hypothetical protein
VPNLLSTYTVRPDGKIAVVTEYCDAVVSQCRKWAGKYEGGAWILSGTRLADVQSLLGVDCTDLVEVELGADKIVGSQYLRCGWYILAGRRGRDNRADVYADLVDGEIPGCGGSVKNPRVGESDDAKFRLWVPRDFAAGRSLIVVTDPLAPASTGSLDPTATSAALAGSVGLSPDTPAGIVADKLDDDGSPFATACRGDVRDEPLSARIARVQSLMTSLQVAEGDLQESS